MSFRNKNCLTSKEMDVLMEISMFRAQGSPPRTLPSCGLMVTQLTVHQIRCCSAYELCYSDRESLQTSVIFLTAVAVNPTVLSNVRSEVLTAVLLKFKDLWDVMLHHCISSSGCCEGMYSLHVQGEAVQKDCVQHYNPPKHR